MKGKNRKIKYELVYDIENIKLAEKEAGRGKTRKYGVRKFRKTYEENINILHLELLNKTFHTDPPNFKIKYCDHKTRMLAKVKFRNHIAHHALMQVILPTLEKSYYYESAASIKGRGIHYSAKHVRKFLNKNQKRDLWWVKIDFTKFYHNVVRQKLYDRLCKEFIDEGIRYLLHDIIWALGNHNGLEPSDGTRGVGIGLYPIQPLVNFYLNDFDREIAKFPNTKMFRYCDDILIIGYDAKSLQKVIDFIKYYAKNILELPIHTNIGIQKLDKKHPIDFVGYKFYKSFTLIRNSIKYKFKQRVHHAKTDKLNSILAAYKGWLKYCQGHRLWKITLKDMDFSDFNLKNEPQLVNGKRMFDEPAINISLLVGRKIQVIDFESGCTTKYGNGRAWVVVIDNDRRLKYCTNNQSMISQLEEIRKQGGLPFNTTILKSVDSKMPKYYFT